jgi:hypothetical protein
MIDIEVAKILTEKDILRLLKSAVHAKKNHTI